MEHPQSTLAQKYARLLQDCRRSKDLCRGRRIHACITEMEPDTSLHLGNTLIHMYARCGVVSDGRHVFDGMIEHNLFSWSTIILAYAENGPVEEAIRLYHHLQCSGSLLDKYCFLSALKACISLRSMASGRHIHSDVIMGGFETDIFVCNTLIDMYAKCYSMDDARQLLNTILKPDIVTWNVIMTGCLYEGLHEECMGYLFQMQVKCIEPNNTTLMLALKACIGCESLMHGKQLHMQILESFVDGDIPLSNTILDMYAKSGDVDNARLVFMFILKKDLTTWNVMIAAYAKVGLLLEAYSLFMSMRESGFVPDEVTFSTILKASTNVEHVHYGHSHLVASGMRSDTFTGNIVIEMYINCGSYDDAWEVFNRMPYKNNVTWNVIIAGCGQCGLIERATSIFNQLLLEGDLPDKVAALSIIKLCTDLTISGFGKIFHLYVVEMGVYYDVSVSNSLIEMYTRCGSIEKASRTFLKMQVHDVTSWNILLNAFVQQGLETAALTLFAEMLRKQVEANHATFSSILKVCASMAVLEWGMALHTLVCFYNIESNVSVGSALVDMYAKCGVIKDAFNVFDNMQDRQVITWTALIAGCSLQGLCKEALELGQMMLDEDVKPDNVTFVAVLSACARAGLLQEGYHNFVSMTALHGVTPTAEHVACMVDLLGRAGHVLEAKCLIAETSNPPDDVTWMALLDACRIHGNVEMGRYAFKCIMAIEPTCSQAYVVLSNIYALASMRSESLKLRNDMKCVSAINHQHFVK